MPPRVRPPPPLLGAAVLLVGVVLAHRFLTVAPSSVAAEVQLPIAFEYGAWVGATETDDQQRVWRADATFSVSRPADCANLPRQYFTRFCSLLLVGDWRDIEIPSALPGPSVEMTARLIRAELDHDTSVCRDDLVEQYVSLGTHVDRSRASSVCERSISKDQERGFVELTDPTTLFNEKTFLVRLP